MDNGDLAAVLFNRHSTTQNVTAHWSDLGIQPDYALMHVRDLWQHRDLGLFNASFTATLRPHASLTIRLHATDPAGLVAVAQQQQQQGQPRSVMKQ